MNTNGTLHVRVAAVVLICAASVIVPSAQTPPHDPEWTAPAEYDALTNPLATRPDTAAGGAKLFAQRCASCHGRDGRGTRKAPDLANAAVQQQPDGSLFWKISSGNTRTGMPAFSFLPELQRWQLVLHVRSFAPAR